MLASKHDSDDCALSLLRPAGGSFDTGNRPAAATARTMTVNYPSGWRPAVSGFVVQPADQTAEAGVTDPVSSPVLAAKLTSINSRIPSWRWSFKKNIRRHPLFRNPHFNSTKRRVYLLRARSHGRPPGLVLINKEKLARCVSGWVLGAERSLWFHTKEQQLRALLTIIPGAARIRASDWLRAGHQFRQPMRDAGVSRQREYVGNLASYKLVGGSYIQQLLAHWSWSLSPTLNHPIHLHRVVVEVSYKHERWLWLVIITVDM